MLNVWLLWWTSAALYATVLLLIAAFVGGKWWAALVRARRLRRAELLQRAYGGERFAALARRLRPDAEAFLLARLREGDSGAWPWFPTLGLVSEYRAARGSSDWRVRARLAQKAALLPDRYLARELLAPLLEDTHRAVREAAVRAVAERRDPVLARQVLRTLERANDFSLYRLARHSLANCDRAVVPALLQGTRSGNQKVRHLCLDVLSDVGDGRTLPLLLELARDPDLEIRLRAARALRHFDTASARQTLLRRLAFDERWEVRAQAARSLGHVPGDEALRVLAELVRDASYWVRNNAADALFRHGDAGHDVLQSVAHGPDRYAAQAARERLHRRPELERRRWTS